MDANFQQSETHARLIDRDQIVFADTAEGLGSAAQRGDLEFLAWAHGLYPGRKFALNELPEVRWVGVWNAVRRQRWGWDWHHNEGLKFMFVERGQVTFATDEVQLLLKAGDLVITRPWQRHRLGNPEIGASQVGWLVLDLGVRSPAQDWCWPDWVLCSALDLEGLGRHLNTAHSPVWRGGSEVLRCFQRLRQTVDLEDASQVVARIKLMVNELLVASVELLEGQVQAQVPTASSELVRRFLFALLPNRLEEDWTLEDLAAACGLGRSQFTQYCVELTNMTPMDYLNRSRIHFAVRLLKTQPGLSITEVGFRCGFHSSQYFARSFRAYIGCSPSEYRAGRSFDPLGLDLSPI